MTDASPLTAAQLKTAKAAKKSPDKRSPDKKKRVRGAAQRDWFGALMSLAVLAAAVGIAYLVFPTYPSGTLERSSQAGEAYWDNDRRKAADAEEEEKSLARLLEHIGKARRLERGIVDKALAMIDDKADFDGGALVRSSTPPLELVQEGGDVLFVPAGWAHSTLNVEVSVGVVHDNWRVPLIDSCEADKMTRV